MCIITIRTLLAVIFFITALIANTRAGARLALKPCISWQVRITRDRSAKRQDESVIMQRAK